MRPSSKQLLVLLLAIVAVGVVFEIGSNPGHHAPAGERLVTIHTRQTRFDPDSVTVRLGETVHILLDNHDSTLHDLTTDAVAFLVIGSGGAEHAGHGAVESTLDAGRPGPLHVAADAKKRARLVFQATEPGRFDFYCTVPGHKQAGMVGVLVVEA